MSETANEPICLGPTDPRRERVESECGGHASTVYASDCTNDRFRTFDPNSIHQVGSWCNGLYPPNYKAWCYRSDYPQDLASKFNCCTGYTEQKNCDPSYTDVKSCPQNASACRSVYAQYCSDPGRINSTECLRLLEADKSLYRDIVAPYCVTNNTDGSRFNDAVCKAFCTDDLGQCEAKLRQVCADKKPNDPTWSGICGCWHSPDVYKTFYDSLARAWNVPEGFFSQPPACGFPECKLANPAFRPKETCTPLNITTCLQNVTIDASGAVINNSEIKVTQTAECKSSYVRKSGGPRKCATDADCGTGGSCDTSTGTCSSVGPIPCTGQSMCLANEQCVNGLCVPTAAPSPPPEKKFPWLTVVIIVVVVALLVGGGALALHASHKAKAKAPKAETATVTAPTAQAKPADGWYDPSPWCQDEEEPGF